jgi:UDP-GlcNAc:undecaprenyl-phosphate GlcNAc-1-phosphate transferase
MRMEIALAFAISFATTLFITPYIRKISISLGIIDRPTGGRKIHSRPVTRWGGTAMLLGFLLSLLLTSSLSTELREILLRGGTLLELVGILIGTVLVWAIGSLDDKFDLKPWQKFLGQIIAASIPISVGVRIYGIADPIDRSYIAFGLPLSIALTLLWMVGITNSFNFIDGLDGLAAGVASISSLAFLVISLKLAEATQSITVKDHSLLAAVLSSALAGGSLAFLRYNFNPAKIFMGDSGAYFLGFALSSISVIGTLKSTAAVAIILPVLVVGLPISDVFVACVGRLRKGIAAWSSSKDHIHHKLLGMGLSQRRAVLILYFISLILSIIAIIIAFS